MKLILYFPFICSAILSFAQTKISGKVTDPQGNPIPMANIILYNTYDGTTSDVNGDFDFTTTETGQQLLIVKFMGYKEFTMMLDLQRKPISLNVILEEQISELKAVTISAGSFTASDESRRTVFRAVDIATTAGATADIAGALNTLPGTQKVGESGRLFVRGGEGSEARTFIDGMVVLDAYSPSAPNTPSRGRFLPFMFKGTSFSTGGYSAEYGQALSSALVLDSKDQSEITRTDIGLLSVGGDVAHTQAWKGGSAAGKIQYTNIRPYFGLIDQRVDWRTPPASLEGVGALRQKIGESGILKFYGNFNQSDFSLYNHDIDDPSIRELFDLSNKYQYLNGFYKNALNKNWIVRGGLSYSNILNEVLMGDQKLNNSEKGIHAKSVFVGSLSEKIELTTGAELISTRNEKEELAFDETIGATFAEADIYTSNNFVTRLGVRSEYNSRLNTFSVDPRISLAYKTGSSSQLGLAFGNFRQSPKSEWLHINNKLKSEKAEHYIFSFQKIENNRTFRVESYYKRYSDLVKYTSASFTSLDNNGTGYAKGIEVFWRDNETFKNTDYWISYSFLDTKRNYLDFPYEAVPAFASAHNFSAVYKYFIQQIKSQLGVTYSFASGRPYYNPNSESFHKDRTPHYADLSFNWSYLPKPYLIVYFSCTNLLGRNNVFGYEYSHQVNDSGSYASRPVEQPAKRFLFIGIFLTLTKDKTVNQLPSL